MQSIREMHRDNERRYHESQFIRDDIRHYADRLVTVIPQKKSAAAGDASLTRI